MANRFIDKVSLFAALHAADVADLERPTNNARWYEANHDLIREGDEPVPVLVVLEGWAYRYKILSSGSRQVVGFLMPGDTCYLHIGLLAAMDHSIQTATKANVATIVRGIQVWAGAQASSAWRT